MATSFTVLSIITLALLLASATATTTTTTTVEIVNDSVDDQPGRECLQKIETERLRSCRNYLRDSSKFPVVMMPTSTEWREEFPRCCEELERVTQNCRCQAVAQVAQEERQEGRLQGREMREMLKTAQSLPSLCRIPPHYCGGRLSMF